MCLIINREKGQTISGEFFKDVHSRNKDGWGVMYNSTKDGRVIVKKGLVLEEFLTLYDTLQSKDIPCVIHFRMKTHGPVNVENCHPFEVVRGVHFMHNGTIDVTIPKKDADKASDTNIFVRDVLKPLLLSVKDKTSALRSSWFEHFMDAQADSHRSRFVLMDEEGPMFYGEWTKTTKGVWCSNTYAYTLDNPSKQYQPTQHIGYGSGWRGGSSGNYSYFRMKDEGAVDFYRRFKMNKDFPYSKVWSETDGEYALRKQGAYESRLKLPAKLDESIVEILAEKGWRTVGDMTQLILRTEFDAKRYLEEVGKSAAPFTPQNTQETKNLGTTQPKDTKNNTESPENSGKDSVSNHGNKQETTRKDPFNNLGKYDNWVDLVEKLNARGEPLSEGDFSDKAVEELLQDELEEMIDQFTEVAENDWLLDDLTIELLTEKLLSGEMEFIFKADGTSVLVDVNGGVLYPDALYQCVAS